MEDRDRIEGEIQSLSIQREQYMNAIRNIETEIVKRQGILEYLASKEVKEGGEKK